MPSDVIFKADRGEVNRAVRQFRRYLNLVDHTLEAFEAEDILRREGTRFVYLIDFQEIYAYLAPHLWSRPREKYSGDRYFATTRFFDDLKESIYFPLGTLAELTEFLQYIRRKIRSLQSVALSTDPDGALAAFLDFFSSEKFLEDEHAPLLRLTEEEDPARRLRKTQSAAITVLDSFEMALEKLYSLVNHPNIFTFGNDLDLGSVRLERGLYQKTLRELEELRGARQKTLNNKADAFNLAFAVTLNNHYLSAREQGKLDQITFFKLLTDTRSLFRVEKRLDFQLTFRDVLGSDLNLLDRYDEALYKRSLSRLDGDSFVKFASCVREAKTAHTKLNQVAISHRTDAEDLLLRLRDLDESDLVIELNQNLRPIYSFFQMEPDVLGDIRHTVRREQLLAPPHPQEDAEFMARPFDAGGVERLEHLLASVQRAVESLDVLGLDLKSEQRKPFPDDRWNPILTLERLGFKHSYDEEDQVWSVAQIGTNRQVFTVEYYESYFSAYWPTNFGPLESVRRLQGLLESDQWRPIELIVIDTRGQSEVYELATINSPDPLLVLSEDEVAFYRLELVSMAFISEVFTTDANYQLKTGLIAENFNLGSLVSIFEALSGSVVPSQMLLRRLQDTWHDHFPESDHWRLS